MCHLYFTAIQNFNRLQEAANPPNIYPILKLYNICLDYSVQPKNLKMYFHVTVLIEILTVVFDYFNINMYNTPAIATAAV